MYRGFIIALICLCSCKPDPGRTGPTLTNDIAGQLYLLGTNDQVEPDSSGVVISIDNTAYTTTSLKNGWWYIKDVPLGSYDITYSKPGYFIKKNFNLKVGAESMLYVRLEVIEHISASVFTQFAVTPVDSTKTVQFRGTVVPCDPYWRTVFIFVSKSAIRDTVPISTPIALWAETNTTASAYAVREASFFASIGSRGDTLYAIGCVGGFGNTSYCYNPHTGQCQFYTPGITFSNQVRFVLP